MSFQKKKDFTARKSDIATVGEAFQDLLKAYKLNGKFDEKRIVASWPSLMGNTIAKRTDKVYMKDRKLYVKLNSAPLKQELIISRAKIIEIFRKEFGKEAIEDIVLY
ncbi:DUF721 domain-containing protein [Fulvivirgaceae bacterium BMA10]|uniref:DUF721 domain-containing protein n=1 Tax=Splendidivirga corallicola TaxID=3051826 RepID=A0ABT8KYG8_9BACT|nr:DUF721 domain-containing protein [Fulvivirgaceae bacterium BMA10]